LYYEKCPVNFGDLSKLHSRFVLYKNTLLDRRDRKIATFFFLAIGLLTVVDIIEDAIEGTTIAHVSVEALIVLFALLGAWHFWRRATSKIQGDFDNLKGQLKAALESNSQFRAENEKLYRGFVEAVEQQFEKWEMSTAESEVAFMLLKGLSVKEIAVARDSSENTVRQQSAAIYRKSKLEGRAQLAAYFLEDLFDKPEKLKQ
jgi:DNA-binding CsgD family transcriptional regulator